MCNSYGGHSCGGHVDSVLQLLLACGQELFDTFTGMPPKQTILSMKSVERRTVVVADVERGESRVLLQKLRQDSKSESE